MPVVKLKSGSPPRRLDPMIAGDLVAVFIDLAIPVLSGGKLAGRTASINRGPFRSTFVTLNSAAAGLACANPYDLGNWRHKDFPVTN